MLIKHALTFQNTLLGLRFKGKSNFYDMSMDIIENENQLLYEHINSLYKNNLLSPLQLVETETTYTTLEEQGYSKKVKTLQSNSTTTNNILDSLSTEFLLFNRGINIFENWVDPYTKENRLSAIALFETLLKALCVRHRYLLEVLKLYNQAKPYEVFNFVLSHIREHKQPITSADKPLSRSEQEQQFLALLTLLPKKLELDENANNYQDNCRFDDQVKLTELPPVSKEYQNLILSHTFDYEDTTDINRNILNVLEWVYNSKENRKLTNFEICADIEGSTYGAYGVALKGKVHAVGFNDLYSSFNVKTGERTIPYFAVQDYLLKEYKPLEPEKDYSYEFIVTPQEIEYLWYKPNSFGYKSFFFENPQISQLVEKYKIPILDASKIKR